MHAHTAIPTRRYEAVSLCYMLDRYHLLVVRLQGLDMLPVGIVMHADVAVVIADVKFALAAVKAEHCDLTLAEVSVDTEQPSCA